MPMPRDVHRSTARNGSIVMNPLVGVLSRISVTNGLTVMNLPVSLRAGHHEELFLFAKTGLTVMSLLAVARVQDTVTNGSTATNLPAPEEAHAMRGPQRQLRQQPRRLRGIRTLIARPAQQVQGVQMKSCVKVATKITVQELTRHPAPATDLRDLLR